MLQLCYASRATQSFDAATLTALLQKSRNNNRARNISGLLVYDNGSFLQLLEGDDRVVIQTYNTIQRDLRHADHLVLFKESITARAFENWDMGFVDLHNPDLLSLPGYHNLFSKDFPLSEFRRDGERARLVFIQFKDGLWHRPVNLTGQIKLTLR